jgi:hypothetical protein
VSSFAARRHAPHVDSSDSNIATLHIDLYCLYFKYFFFVNVARLGVGARRLPLARQIATSGAAAARARCRRRSLLADCSTKSIATTIKHYIIVIVCVDCRLKCRVAALDVRQLSARQRHSADKKKKQKTAVCWRTAQRSTT